MIKPSIDGYRLFREDNSKVGQNLSTTYPVICFFTTGYIGFKSQLISRLRLSVKTFSFTK